MAGFSLIEILITLFVISVGILGIIGLQLSSLRVTQNAYFQSIAITQLTALIERMRAHKPENWPTQLLEWNTINLEVLPQGKGTYACMNEKNEKTVCTITLLWEQGKLEIFTQIF
jgi:prepilin-type N-terminal cleavage/methylation domain-containing protein